MSDSYRASLIIAGFALGLCVISWRLIQLETLPVSPSRPLVVQRQAAPPVETPPARTPQEDPKPSEQDRAAALFEAARKGDVAGILGIVSKGANINTKNEEGLTLLLALAKEGNHSDLIQKLLEHGANAAAKDSKGWNALTWAADRDDVSTLSVLLKHSPNLANDAANALFQAAMKNHVESLKTLLDNGADVNGTDKDGRTALHYAAESGDGDTLKFLLDHNADLNHKTTEGSTPLMLAVKRGEKGMVESLLDKSANVNERNSKGETALMQAIRVPNADISRMLLDAGSDVNGADFEGTTPLMAAADAGQKDIVEQLLDKNADATVKNSQGDTALSLARKNDHSEIADLLAKAGGGD
jgi:ankyrin repeat protein